MLRFIIFCGGCGWRHRCNVKSAEDIWPVIDQVCGGCENLGKFVYLDAYSPR